jgi:Terminase large subunit, T4likevirus-type, N-terminal
VLKNDLRHALDPVAWAEEALGLTLDPWQAKVIGSTSKRDILNCSRQAGKSTTSSVIALHTAKFVPDSLTLLFSPSFRQSKELFRKVMSNLERLSDRPKMLEENTLSVILENGGRIVALPGSADTVRGFSGATLIIEDEAAFVEDELYFAIRPMLATSGGRLILMSTPFGKRGHFWQVWDEGQDWHRVKVPATEIPRIAPSFLEEERAAMGEWRFKQEYMCEFVENEDAFFSYDTVMGALAEDVQPLF